MKALMLVTSLLLLGSPALAQQSVVSQVKAELEAAGVSLSGPCGGFQITKHVAWRLRSEATGLLSKPTGNNCEGYAVDIVAFPSGRIIDVLVDAGGSNGPAWNEGEPVDPSRYRPAFDPGAITPTPDPLPVPVPQPPNTDIAGKLDKIADDLARIEAKVEQTDADVNQGRKEVAEFRSAVRERWLAVTKFAGKYILPAIAAYLAGRELQ